MYDHHHIITAFSKLGHLFRHFRDPDFPDPDGWALALKEAVRVSELHNGWFTEEQVHHALSQWGDLLREESLTAWCAPYALSGLVPRKIGIVMAGNIPLVGFHDLLCVLLAGHTAVVKLSSHDGQLLPFVARFLSGQAPDLGRQIVFAEGKLEGFDAVIATGSDNTARYFEYYFGKVPHLIRKNRNSVAVLTGGESSDDLKRLGSDVFCYFGLGCRSVSKIFVPKGYDFTALFEALYAYRHLIDHPKYANNYDYNKAVYLMSEFKIFDNGFVVLKEDGAYTSPIASLFYEYYGDQAALKSRLEADADRLQCVVSNGFSDDAIIPFGSTQCPPLDAYADGVDTLDFLVKVGQR